MYFCSAQFIWLSLEKYNVEQVTTVTWVNGFNYNNRNHIF